MFFLPMKQLVRTPADISLQYHEVLFNSSDGTSLYGWMLPAQGKAKGSILFFHGNAENISTHIGSVYWLPSHGYNVFLFDYRGYGKSAGTPELNGIMNDAQAAIVEFTKLPEVINTPKIVYGQSIGASIATYAVAHSGLRDKIDAVILESGFSSYRLIAREKLRSFWLTWPLQYPLSWTISDRYKPLEAIPLIAPIPLLLVYSQEDNIVPASHGQQLLAAAKDPKQLWLYANGRHISAFVQTEQRQRLLEYLDAIIPRRKE